MKGSIFQTLPKVCNFGQHLGQLVWDNPHSLLIWYGARCKNPSVLFTQYNLKLFVVCVQHVQKTITDLSPSYCNHSQTLKYPFLTLLKFGINLRTVAKISSSWPLKTDSKIIKGTSHNFEIFMNMPNNGPYIRKCRVTPHGPLRVSVKNISEILEIAVSQRQNLATII